MAWGLRQGTWALLPPARPSAPPALFLYTRPHLHPLPRLCRESHDIAWLRIRRDDHLEGLALGSQRRKRLAVCRTPLAPRALRLLEFGALLRAALRTLLWPRLCVGRGRE